MSPATRPDSATRPDPALRVARAARAEIDDMFAEPAGFPHRAHRWIRKLRGRLPA